MKHPPDNPCGKIMIIEDNAAVRFALVMILSKYPVLTVHSGEEALSSIEKNGPIDIVICDYNLPGWNGVETMKRFRAQSPRTKFILISAVDPQLLAHLALEATFDAWLNKPFSVEDLLKHVERLLLNP